MVKKKTSGTRGIPLDMKNCMRCGQVVPWDGDCSFGHFAQIGREIRYKASKVGQVQKKEKISKGKKELPLFGE